MWLSDKELTRVFSFLTRPSKIFPSRFFWFSLRTDLTSVLSNFVDGQETDRIAGPVKGSGLVTLKSLLDEISWQHNGTGPAPLFSSPIIPQQIFLADGNSHEQQKDAHWQPAPNLNSYTTVLPTGTSQGDPQHHLPEERRRRWQHNTLLIQQKMSFSSPPSLLAGEILSSPQSVIPNVSSSTAATAYLSARLCRWQNSGRIQLSDINFNRPLVLLFKIHSPIRCSRSSSSKSSASLVGRGRGQVHYKVHGH